MAGSNSRALTIFFGEEEYLLDRELARALKWPDRMVMHLEGAEASEADVVSAMEEFTIDGSKVVVVLDNAEKVKLGKEFAAYLAQRDLKDKGTMLIAICHAAKLPKGWEMIADNGRVIEHPKLKAWEEEKLGARLQREAAFHGLTLEGEVKSLFLKLYRDDSCQMANEVRKLAFLLDRGGKITAELVRATCPQRFSVFPWDVAEEAVQRHPKRALSNISLLFEDKGDEVVIPIVAALMKQVERLLLLRSMLDQGKTPEAMASVIGIHPYIVKKTLPVVNGYTAVRLREQMEKLCVLEVQVKGSSPSKRTLVELAVLSLAA